MHDCALGGQGGPSAPRVEHNYYIHGESDDKKVQINRQDVGMA